MSPAIQGPEMAAQILWAPGIFGSFCKKTSMLIEIPVFWSVFWVLWWGEEVPILFRGRGIFWLIAHESDMILADTRHLRKWWFFVILQQKDCFKELRVKLVPLQNKECCLWVRFCVRGYIPITTDMDVTILMVWVRLGLTPRGVVLSKRGVSTF